MAPVNPSESMPMPDEDEFGEFIKLSNKGSNPVPLKPVEPDADDFGEYEQGGKAPVQEELSIPDEDEFGNIPEDNPSKV